MADVTRLLAGVLMVVGFVVFMVAWVVSDLLAFFVYVITAVAESWGWLEQQFDDFEYGERKPWSKN